VRIDQAAAPETDDQAPFAQIGDQRNLLGPSGAGDTAMSDPEVLANGYVTEVEYPTHGKNLKVHGSPWHFSETPTRVGCAPALGEHNGSVLLELG
jgi:crotonobetainyl-CoA:carnitine CoA-transferase CaiB-like acyl-CoA transferase